MDEAKESEMISENEKLRMEINKLRSMSVVEMMGENMNVKHHVSDWEHRCLKAEKDVTDLNRVFRDIGWGQGEIDSSATIAEENELLNDVRGKNWFDLRKEILK